MFAVLAVGASAYTLLQSFVIPILARIQVEFRTDQATVTWILTAYLLSASIATPLLGRIGDTVGKRRMLVITLAALSLGSLIAALAPSIGWLIAARVVQGVGGGVIPLTYGIIRDEFVEHFTLAISVIASLASVGVALGIVSAGPIVQLLGYRWLFWLPMIVTSAAAVAGTLVIPESPIRKAGRIPMLPALLLASWLFALLLDLSQGSKWGWNSPRTLTLLGAAICIAAIWAWTEERVAVPLIDMQLMRQRGVWSANLVALFMGIGIYSAVAFIAQLLQTPSESGYGFGASISESGLLLLPSALGSIIVGVATARAVARVGARGVVFVGGQLAAVALLAIALFHTE